MIKDNQTLLNRIHVVVDALVIACTYIAAWFIQFEFSHRMLPENFRLRRICQPWSF